MDIVDHTKPIPNPEETEAAYMLFTRLCDDNEFVEAYKVYEANPTLIDHMPVGHFADFYVGLRRALGEEKATDFVNAGIKTLKEILDGTGEVCDIVTELVQEARKK